MRANKNSEYMGTKKNFYESRHAGRRSLSGKSCLRLWETLRLQRMPVDRCYRMREGLRLLCKECSAEPGGHDICRDCALEVRTKEGICQNMGACLSPLRWDRKSVKFLKVPEWTEMESCPEWNPFEPEDGLLDDRGNPLVRYIERLIEERDKNDDEENAAAVIA